jgi:hypothetical protein
VIMIASGFAGDQLPEIFAISRAIVGRVPGPRDSTATMIPGELRHDGIWAVLPTLNDIPEGFVFFEDRLPGEASSAMETPTP